VGDSIVKSLSDLRSDGSYADAAVGVDFGSLHASSDAQSSGASSPGLYAGSSAQTEFIDYIKPWQSSPVGFTAYTLTLAISGTHYATDGYGAQPGYLAQADVSYDVRDNRTGDILAAGNWTSSDLVSSTTLMASIAVPPDEATDDLRIDVSLGTFTSVDRGNEVPYLNAFADHSHTLVAHLDAVTAGASTVGVSGFDYATASVPEPATPLSMSLGGAAWLLARRRWAPASSAR
jgi:hypothetical protein